MSKPPRADFGEGRWTEALRSGLRALVASGERSFLTCGETTPGDKGNGNALGKASVDSLNRIDVPTVVILQVSSCFIGERGPYDRRETMTLPDGDETTEFWELTVLARLRLERGGIGRDWPRSAEGGRFCPLRLASGRGEFLRPGVPDFLDEVRRLITDLTVVLADKGAS